MSDNHHDLVNGLSQGLICHMDSFIASISSLFLNERFSDIYLVVDGKRIPAHRVVLAARSEYFRALLYGGLKESHEPTIELKTTCFKGFELLLRYIYFGQISVVNLDKDTLLELLALSNEYGLVELESALSFHLGSSLVVENVCHVYEAANLYGLESLKNKARNYIDHHAVEVMQHESFLSLSLESLKEMISRDSFCAEEIKIFQAVCQWVKANPDYDKNEVLSCLRMSLMSIKDLLSIVRPTKMVSAEVILDAIEDFTSQNFNYRGLLIPEVNVASTEHGATVLVGGQKSFRPNVCASDHDIEKGLALHPIDDNASSGIIISLGHQSIVNHIKLLLWDLDSRSYSYYIEVSIDQKDWIRVIDHTHYLCRSWQYLYFSPRVVKYIRIVGTHNSVNRMFHCVTFECLYTNKPFTLDQNGILKPTTNVAIPRHACVIEGVSRNPKKLINGGVDFNYDWNKGYICHQIGSGCIMIRLSQPFVINSMKLLLWDLDSRSYSYYIEVSIDSQNWHVVVDKRDEQCRSWQIVKFEPRPVIFIKIVGTNNTENEVFHCVYFECPAQEIQSPKDQENHDNSTEEQVERK